MKAAAATALLLGLTASGCALQVKREPAPAEPQQPPSSSDPVPSPAANPWAEPVRDVLFQNCRPCHQGGAAGSVDRALAVFDLTETPWHIRIRSEQLDGLLSRLRAKKDIAPGDLSVVERFIACARDGACGPAEPATSAP